MERYYQIDGRNPGLKFPFRSFNQYREPNYIALWDILAGDTSPLRTHPKIPSVELVLGITYTGETHLLLAESQLSLIHRVLQKHIRPNEYHEPSRQIFESLSGITFTSSAGLKQACKRLDKKSKGNDKVVGCDFEYGRLLHYLLTSPPNPQKFNSHALSPSSILIYTIKFNIAIGPGFNRNQEPKILDLAWMAVSTLTFSPIPAQGGTNEGYVLVDDNKTLGQVNKKALYSTPTTPNPLLPSPEILPKPIISARLRTLFTHLSSSSKPVILLIHDEKKTKAMLNSFDIDTSAFVSGIAGIVGQGAEFNQRRNNYSNNANANGWDRRSVKREYNSDPRSRSPPRGPRNHHQNQRSNNYPSTPHGPSSNSYPSNSNSYPYPPTEDHKPPPDSKPPPSTQDTKPPAPPPSLPPLPPKIHLIDLRTLYTKTLKTSSDADSIFGMASPSRLNVAHEERTRITDGNDKDREGFCALGEARVMIKIWYNLISGPSFLEREIACDTRSTSSSSTSFPSSSSTTPAPVKRDEDADDENADADEGVGDEDDDDDDEMNPMMLSAARAKQIHDTSAEAYLAAQDEDDWDEGSD